MIETVEPTDLLTETDISLLKDTLYGDIPSELLQQKPFTVDEIHPTQLFVPEGLPDYKRDFWLTIGRIRQARLDEKWFSLKEEGIDQAKRLTEGEFIFLVHPRNLVPDVSRQYPLLHPRYMSREMIGEIVRDLPPAFRASRITNLKNYRGEEVKGWVVITTMVPEWLDFRDKESRKWGTGRQLVGAKLGYMLGGDLLGLGATTSMLLHHGRVVKEQLPIEVTTGHSYTSWLIRRTLLEVSNLTEQKLEAMTVAVVGAAGSIGSSAVRFCKGRVKELVQIDIQPQVGMESSYGGLKRADVVIAATTTAKPFITSDMLKTGVVVIDDSAPESIAKGVAEEKGGFTVHVLADQGKDRVDCNFDFGYLPGANFGCLAEAASVIAQGDLTKAMSGRVSEESIQNAAALAQAPGFDIAPLQSYGVPINVGQLQLIKEYRKNQELV